MSVYRRGDVWWYKFNFHGVTIRESSGLSNKEAARDVERKRHLELREGRAGIVKPDAIPMFKIAAEDWLKAKGPEWAPKTAVIEKTNLGHLSPVFGTRLLSDISAVDVGHYREQRMKVGAAAKTISLELGTLRAIMCHYDLDAKWRAIRKKVKMPKQKQVGRVVTTAEEDALLRECRKSRSRSLPVAVLLAFETAMRYSEIRTLQWRHVDLGRRVVTVGQSKTAAGTGREIPLTARAHAALSSWAALFPGRKPGHFAFPSENYGQPKDGKEITSYNTDPAKPISTWKEGWEHAKKRAGVECRFHDLRHTACTRMLEAGVPHSTVAEIMGWSASTAILLIREVYGHISPRAKRSAIDLLEQHNAAQREIPSEVGTEVGTLKEMPTGRIQ